MVNYSSPQIANTLTVSLARTHINRLSAAKPDVGSVEIAIGIAIGIDCPIDGDDSHDFDPDSDFDFDEGAKPSLTNRWEPPAPVDAESFLSARTR